MQDATINLNHNTAECIKSATQLTGTVYYNICDGTHHLVPFGAVDYLIGGLLLLFLATVVYAIMSVFRSMLKM